MLKQKITVLAKLTMLGLAALVLALLTLLGTAFLTDDASLLIGAALVVLCLANFIGQYFLLGRRFIKRTIAVQGVSALVLLSVFYIVVLMPTAGERLPDLAGVQYWDLATGSRIAYIRVEPEKPTHAEPIVFLHGGPGIADLEGDVAYFGNLRDEGYAVYVYDQVGTGRSSRLQDPRGYTMERNLADLEAIREQIGAEKMILIGYSYGASLAATYIAQDAKHVAKLIVISPGSLVGGTWGGSALRERFTTAQTWSIYARILQPRSFTAYALMLINPRAAHNFAGDAEMDARNDTVYAIGKPALHCVNNPGSAHRIHGLGFYSSQYPLAVQHAPTKEQTKDAIDTLQRHKIPTLVIKGSCDYLTWASALDYLDAFQAGPAQLVYLSGAGHNAYQDKPREFELNVEAFLNGQPLPNQYFHKNVPADYEKGS